LYSAGGKMDKVSGELHLLFQVKVVR
jgi:hypothetical protein